ncbi:MAG TPA: DUF2889 domain-containing protein [Acidimicrobiales bacterium]|nr:DUF2889 domain-containing protein [Acidimicrobiales bacterium]
MAEGTPAYLRNPLPTVPARRAGGRRRTMSIDIGPSRGYRSSLDMTGMARDIRTGEAGPDGVTVLADASVVAGFDLGRQLVSLETAPPAPWAQALVGARAGGGFRRHLDAVVPAEEAGSLLRQVLDDMPAAALISGYAWLRFARREGHDPATLMPADILGRMTDLCSGWRAGGVAVTSIETDHGMPIQDCPPAPADDGADPWAWHPMAPLDRDWMRRRRCLDVAVDAAGRFSIWAMFRDTVGEAPGAELVLHEYAVTASGSGSVVESVTAEPRVLPFPECPGAADAVGDLVGCELAGLSASVPEILTGIRSCTHLNDLLRALGGVAGLVTAARAS